LSCRWTCGRGSAGRSLNRRRGEQGADRNPGACRTTGVGGRACEDVVAPSVAAGLRAGAMRASTGSARRGRRERGVLQRGGVGLTRSCCLRPPATGAWKKRGVPGEPDEYLPTACGSQACEESRRRPACAVAWRRGPECTCCKWFAGRRASAARRPAQRRQTAVVGK
jgi:hypothetical protein